MVPARAGVILPEIWADLLKKRGSRASGGDPAYMTLKDETGEWFPRERG